ncbi:acetolactate decarboxylase [Desulfovibrio aminophilus]|nr:acetolactate decarboxylase [Desulfovibrio aminophilus]MCM0754868.1 acetolactate decarboxylase [Desulfovibrio aminophilus]
MRKALLILAVVLALAVPARAGGPGDRIFQVSVLPALLAGDYEGSLSTGDLLARGDFGLGTFQDLDGEMVVLDGVVWQVPSDGRVRRAPRGLGTPFAAVTFFEPDREVLVARAESLADLERQVDAALPTRNHFYALRIDGRMTRLAARSVPRQDKPWRPLAEVVREQTRFTLDGLEGTLVGLRCPAFVAGVNVPGYHWHFLSADRSKGGHVLDCALENARVRVDELTGLELRLPTEAGFTGLDISGDHSAATKAVEKTPGGKQ